MKKVVKNYMLLLSFLMFFLLVTNCKENKNQKEKVIEQIQNILSRSEIAEGWKLLFDGKTFNGWRGIGIDKVPEGHWEIEDGAIRKIASGAVPTLADGQPQKGGDLMTDETFNNFELTFEWKISEGGNSGVKYNVIEEISVNNGSSNALGFEYQVLDDDQHSDNLNPTHRAASLYDMIEAKGKTVKPVGEFNLAKIIFNGNHGEHWLNGVKVVEYDINTPEFEKIFMNSKYKDKKDFTKHKVAHIVLQDHGDDCWYRNIKIKVLE